MKRVLFVIGFILMAYGVILGIPPVQAQPYPSRPVQLIIPLVPGSALDINGRLFAEEFGKVLGTQVVPMNKPGASLTLGTDAVVKSKKDGYTLAYTNTSAIVYARVLSPEIVPYDPVMDLEPLGLHCFFPLTGAVQEGAPWKTFPELIAYAKKNPGKLRVATHGQGSIDHFNLEIIQSLTGAQFTHVPFKGGQQVITALLGGHVEVIFDALSQVLPHVEGGKMRILLITHKTTDFPNLPTLPELGYKQDLLSAWFALFGPAGTPEEVKKVLVPAIEKVVMNQELKTKIEKMGFIVNYRPPAELKKLMVEDYERAMEIAIKVGLRK
ncbi:MAG TPA: tripartite tricarboxylate transporter substrate binding protein [Thermodesulfobacteriota bacterium]|nr:tripartite tricarboxylate transporter substrate binding protein [Thermodesulfobacteriota bacterium]